MGADTQKLNSGYRALLKASRNTVATEEYAKIRRALDLAVEASGDKIILTGAA